MARARSKAHGDEETAEVERDDDARLERRIAALESSLDAVRSELSVLRSAARKRRRMFLLALLASQLR